MTPKDKAKQLVYKYQSLVNTWDCYNDETLDMIYRLPDMKQCALIAIDLRLEIEYGKDTKEYWKEVKQEIEKI